MIENSKYTRGKGLLENLLARLRAKKADNLIPKHLRQGRILDIGCGTRPYFLSHTFFSEKIAIDQQEPTKSPTDILWHKIDLNIRPHLPFDDNFVDVVTMLAVVEHLNPDSLSKLFKDIYRILKPEGVVVITTPAPWSDRLLEWMALSRLVSEEEIREHAFVYTLPLLGWYFGRAGFPMEKIHFGYFELMFNMWAIAER